MNFSRFSDMRYVGPMPPGVGSMAVRAWEPVFDPLSREDWSERAPVRYAPGAAAEPVLTESAGDAIAESKDDHCSALIPRIEAVAKLIAPDAAVLIEGGPELPVIEPVDPSQLPAALLDAWESTLLEACEAGDQQACWLLTQVFALRLAHVGMPQLHALHRVACAHASRGEEQAPAAAKAAWRARWIELDLALAERLSGASRLFALRDMAVRHAAEVERGAGAVLKIWIEVLLYAAQQQLGDIAADRLADASMQAEHLCGLPDMADEGEYLLAKVLLHRAGNERGDARMQMLGEAQRLLDTLFARAPGPRFAMAVAEATLERARDAAAAHAKEFFSHALAHAFIAGCDPRWQPASLRCRLAIQLAYEALPDMSPQGQVALDLARKLEQQPLPPGTTIEEMAQTFIRHGEYARACRLCARAWLAGIRFRALAAAWQQAGAGWKSQLASAREQADWQDNERQRRIAAQWQ